MTETLVKKNFMVYSSIKYGQILPATKQHLYMSEVFKQAHSSPSSTGTKARCGLWPVEQDPSIFSYLSTTLSIIVKSIHLFPLFDFRNNKFFTVRGC
jgi:hypothetical protein